MRIPTITVRPIDCGCVLVFIENTCEDGGTIAMHLTVRAAGELAEALVREAAAAERRALKGETHAA